MACGHSSHYGSKTKAKRAAEMMGMEGAHKMQCGDETVWMPGKSHKEYMDYNDGPAWAP